MKTLSPLQIERLKYQPKLPECLKKGINSLELVEGSKTESVRDQEQIKELFKNECRETYYVPPLSKKDARGNKSKISKGKLVDKWRNKRTFIRNSEKAEQQTASNSNWSRSIDKRNNTS